MKRGRIAFFIAMVFLAALSTAANTYAACTAITSLPRTLTSAGTYCLTGNLSASITGTNSAITINVDNVVLDLAGYQITNTAVGQGKGIYAKGRNNIIIKNGKMNNFDKGIEFASDAPAIINKNILIDGITVVHRSAGGIPIKVDGFSAIIRNCQIFGFGVIGIQGMGSGIHIINNDVFGSEIYLHNIQNIPGYGDRNIVENNRVSQGTPAAEVLVGIQLLYNTNALIVNNRISDFQYAGIAADPDSTGKYRDNLITGCPTPYSLPTGFIDAGNNN
jgi:hypothetical protein